jgi:amino acid adenylation domain-containing protein
MRLEFDIDCRESAHLRSQMGTETSLCYGAVLDVVLAALATAHGPCRLEDVALLSAIEPSGVRAGHVIFDPKHGAFELLSARDESSRRRLHVTGRASDPEPTALGVCALPRHVDTELTRAEFHRALERVTVTPARVASVIESVCIAAEAAVATIVLDAEQVRAASLTGMHPALMDAVVQVACFLETRTRPDCVHLAFVGSLGVANEEAALPERLLVTRSDANAAGSWDGLVLGAGGRILAALRDLRFASGDERRAHVARGYSSRIERCVEQVLSIAALGPNTDFSEAGATSLDALRLLAALRDDWGWAPSLDSLKLDLAGLTAMYVAEDEPARSALLFDPSEDDLARGDRLSYAERRLWYLERFAAVAGAYNEAVAWRIRGPLNLTALRAALQSLVERHFNLRTTFSEVDGEPRRRVRASSTMDIEIVELLEADPAPRLAAEQRRPFAIDRDVPFRARIFRRSDREAILLLAAHHIVCDEWSLSRVIRRELVHAYGAEIDAREPATTRPLQAAQYSAWERRVVQGPLLEELLDWWVRELDGIPDFLQLPTHRRRPAHQLHRGARVEFRLDPETAADLHRFARSRSVTPFVVLLAAYQVVLFRYSGQSRFAVGVPFSLRDTPALDHTVGCLINTLPIACRMERCESFGDLLEQVSATVARAIVHRHVPFDSIVSRLRCDRTQSHTPLVQVAFSYDEVGPATAELGDAVLEDLPFEAGTSKFDLTMTLREEGDSFAGVFEYSTALFQEHRVRQMLQHFLGVLHEMRSSTDTPLRGNWLLSPIEREQIRGFELGPAVSVSFAPLVISPRSSFATDRAVIDVQGGMVLTYADLAARVDALAARLHEVISGDEALIGISIGRSAAWVIALLAVMRLGRGYLPLAPHTPHRRAIALMGECGIRTMLFTRPDCPWWERFDGRAIEVDTGEQQAPRAADAFAIDASATVYAITTSGSTGMPKTAAVSYSGFSNLIGWYCELLALGREDCLMIATSVAFDLTQKNVASALRAGARLMLAPEGRFDPYQFIDSIEKERVSVLNCTPSLFYAALEASASDKYRALRSLRAVVLGGEVVDLNRLAPWTESGHCGARLFNTYGPTECTDVCAWHEIDVAADANSWSVPIGRPIWNTSLAVLDAAGMRVPCGVIGELCISGAGVGQGYVSNRERSAEPFVELDGQRAYRTGDLVSRMWNGDLVFVGRIDDQVKIRGHRLNLEEVEAALCNAPGVMSAAVSARKIGDSDATLIGYYTADAEITPTALRRCLSEWVPGYMIPSSFVRLASIPLTESGKINRAALPSPSEIRSERADRSPQDDVERALLGLWCRLLGIAAVGVRDVFFEVGGDSLLAIRLAQAIEREVGCRCRVRDVFDHPTIETLADVLRARAQDTRAAVSS